jgi:hypothetical protein
MMFFHDAFRRYGVPLTLAVLLLPLQAAGAVESRVITVHHATVAMTTIPVNRNGGPASLGDVRVANAVLTDRAGSRIGELHGTLTTTAIDAPGPGDEIRQSNLVFQIGRPQDQIVVGGESAYPASGSTIAKATTTIRPILGGSGRYAGARGTARTDHFADGTWRHVFRLMP